MLNENKDAVVAVIVASVLAFVWWAMWVQPNEEIAYQIMDCMGHDTSEQAYEDCRQQVIADREEQARINRIRSTR